MFCLVCLVISNVNEILTQIDISMVLGEDIQILKKNLFVVIWIVECYSKFSICIVTAVTLTFIQYMHLQHFTLVGSLQVSIEHILILRKGSK